MAGSFSGYLENKVLDHVFNATAYTSPVTLYLALYTATPNDDGGGTEVTGGSYARKAVTANTTNFPAASGGSISLNVQTDFVTATANWGTVTALGIFDASTSGNLLAWDDFTGVAINNGDTARINAGGLTITLD